MILIGINNVIWTSCSFNVFFKWFYWGYIIYLKIITARIIIMLYMKFSFIHCAENIFFLISKHLFTFTFSFSIILRIRMCSNEKFKIFVLFMINSFSLFSINSNDYKRFLEHSKYDKWHDYIQIRFMCSLVSHIYR